MHRSTSHRSKKSKEWMLHVVYTPTWLDYERMPCFLTPHCMHTHNKQYTHIHTTHTAHICYTHRRTDTLTHTYIPKHIYKQTHPRTQGRADLLGWKNGNLVVKPAKTAQTNSEGQKHGIICVLHVHRGCVGVNKHRAVRAANWANRQKLTGQMEQNGRFVCSWES